MKEYTVGAARGKNTLLVLLVAVLVAVPPVFASPLQSSEGLENRQNEGGFVGRQTEEYVKEKRGKAKRRKGEDGHWGDSGKLRNRDMTFCSKEGEACECHGSVWFGGKGRWHRKEVKEQILCSREIFGSPRSQLQIRKDGRPDECYCSATGDKVHEHDAKFRKNCRRRYSRCGDDQHLIYGNTGSHNCLVIHGDSRDKKCANWGHLGTGRRSEDQRLSEEKLKKEESSQPGCVDTPECLNGDYGLGKCKEVVAAPGGRRRREAAEKAKKHCKQSCRDELMEEGLAKGDVEKKLLEKGLPGCSSTNVVRRRRRGLVLRGVIPDDHEGFPTPAPAPAPSPRKTTTPRTTTTPRKTTMPRTTTTPRKTTMPRTTTTPRKTTTPRTTTTPRKTTVPRTTTTPRKTTVPRTTTTPRKTTMPPTTTSTTRFSTTTTTTTTKFSVTMQDLQEVLTLLADDHFYQKLVYRNVLGKQGEKKRKQSNNNKKKKNNKKNNEQKKKNEKKKEEGKEEEHNMSSDNTTE